MTNTQFLILVGRTCWLDGNNPGQCLLSVCSSLNGNTQGWRTFWYMNSLRTFECHRSDIGSDLQSKNLVEISMYRISSYSFRTWIVSSLNIFRTFMYCDLWPYVLWSLDLQIQKRLVSAETIWENTVCIYLPIEIY